MCVNCSLFCCCSGCSGLLCAVRVHSVSGEGCKGVATLFGFTNQPLIAHMGVVVRPLHMEALGTCGVCVCMVALGTCGVCVYMVAPDTCGVCVYMVALGTCGVCVYMVALGTCGVCVCTW